jgi:hypothetical protein
MRITRPLDSRQRRVTKTENEREAHLVRSWWKEVSRGAVSLIVRMGRTQTLSWWMLTEESRWRRGRSGGKEQHTDLCGRGEYPPLLGGDRNRSDG